MSAANTDISILSSALNLLGESSIDTLEGDTDAQRVCAQLYPVRKRSLISEYEWSFSKKKVKLARLVLMPISGWRYQFAMPTDRVGDVFALYQSAGVSSRVVTDYAMQSGNLLSNATELWLDYQFDTHENELPPYFVMLLTYALASDLAMPITEQASLADYWHVRAFGSPSENNRGGYFRTAVGIDSRGRPSSFIVADDLIEVRNG